jgi:type III restriction enzyme
MTRFNFEKNLEHQEKAVQAIVRVFDGVEISHPQGLQKEYINPLFQKDTNFRYVTNIGGLQEQNNIERNVKGKTNITDIMMETGTGKTYTYTKTIFELNKTYGIFKFIIVVPTLPIKAGTIDFLRSESSREHFKDQYDKTIQLHVVESKKTKKNKKSFMSPAVNSFVTSGHFEKNKIQVLVINSGMINSPTMQQHFDKSLLDDYTTAFEAISATKSFMIIDEPHKFDQSNKTWKNLLLMNPQHIIRYGATFPENEIKIKNALGRIEKIKQKDYQNHVYSLSAVDSFNKNLVKGVIGHITKFDSGKNIVVKFVNSDGKEATFHLTDGIKTTIIKLIQNESLEKVHSEMAGLIIEKLNKTVVFLSNGLELKKGDKINPYSYAETLQQTMIQKAIRHHFKEEKKLLTREVRIKPLTLFFIDNIDEYRKKEGYIKKTVEKYIEAETRELIKTEPDGFYKTYLEKTLQNITQTHGGYFAIDKKETDEVIEQEVNEILHDKQALLDLDNPRRFIFSKWTLREGWDNPNIFQICKLRSSGSEISKLQEVGRGLRLPVNEYGNRVKDEQFYLNYFVDFTESDFVEKLVNEINEKSGAISLEEIPEKLDEKMIKQIIENYQISEDELFDELDTHNIITRSNSFKENGFEYIKTQYPLIFEGVNSSKIRKSTDSKKKISIRREKYTELKELWEQLNQKVVLKYIINNEETFKDLFSDFLQSTDLSTESPEEYIEKLYIEENKAVLKEYTNIYGKNKSIIKTLKYSDFLKQLSSELYINLKTLHHCFIDSSFNLDTLLNQTTIRNLKHKFSSYLLHKAFSKLSIEYQNVSSSIHPTKLTDDSGKQKKQIDASDIGILTSKEQVAENYLLDELYYDSELEKENIQTQIDDVIVFTKIPKNSIKIPISGGKTYSPDFAYVINYSSGNKKLYFVVETKNADEQDLRKEELQKIRHAEHLFGNSFEIKFRSQFSKQKMTQLIQEIYHENNYYRS